jgi:hypothetical protein
MMKAIHPLASVSPEHSSLGHGSVFDPLNAFVGTWGRAGEEAQCCAVVETGSISKPHAWLDGIVRLYQGDQQVDSGRRVSVRCIEAEVTRTSYVLHCVDDDESEAVYLLSGGGRQWSIAGAGEVATFEFSTDRGTLRIVLAQSDESGTWRQVCDFRLTRLSKP